MLVKESRQRAEEARSLNEMLRSPTPDWESARATVERVNDTVLSTTPTEEGHLEAYLVAVVKDAVLRLWPAVAREDRRGARLAAEQVRQALVDIADAADRQGPRDPKQTVRWVQETVGQLDERTISTLFGVSQRTWGRWMSTSENGTTPSGDDASRLRTVAAALDHLRRSYTPAGAVAWFSRPRPQLDGATPGELLDDPVEHQRIIDLAAGSRVSIAS